jgi:hypothetical protein
MGKAIVMTIKTDGKTTIAAYCLKTDSWQDYLAFRQDAKRASAEGDQRNANRFLRAALTCLFSHLEAVVQDIENNRVIPIVHPGQRLCDRTRNITREAKQLKRKIPYLNFRLEKHLRDLIAHPGIQIDFSDAPNGKLDFIAVFNKLNLSTLEKIETQISPWLDAVCAAFKVPRLTDTKQLVEEHSSKLGSPSEIREV